MIYYKFNRDEQKRLSIRGTFAGQTDTGANLNQAMANPAAVLNEQDVKVDSKKLCVLNENDWFSADSMRSQGYDGFMINRLTCCAAVLLYGEEGNLIAAGHAESGVIRVRKDKEDKKDKEDPVPYDPDKNPDDIAWIESLDKFESIRHIIYATPTLLTGDKKSDTKYGESVQRLFALKDKIEIHLHVVEGFGSNSGSIMGTVIGDMDGNISFQ